MRYVNFKILIPVLLLISTSAGIAAAAEEQSRAEKTARALQEIQNRLDAIEKQQQDILAKEDKILQELDRLRVWVRHN